MIPYSRQSIDESDIAAVAEVMRGDWLTTGPAVEEFEHALADAVGARHVVVVSSGTAALHLALLAARVGPGQRVVTSPISFSASANAARYVGADVQFVDIDDATMNLDPDAVPDDIDALVAVHFAGLPVDLSRLRSRPRIIIEDAAQALGASTPDGPVGSCARSDMTTFSFHPVKSITTGEGGAITTNDDELARRLRVLRSHGIEPTPASGGWSYDIRELGYNYRLTDMQAALGTSQLRRLDHFIEARTRLAERYHELLADIPDVRRPPPPSSGQRHAWHLYVMRVAERRQVYDSMRAAGIGVQVHHVPIPTLSVYRAGGSDPQDYPHATAYYEGALSLPLYPGLTDEQQDFVVACLGEAVGT